MKNDQHTTPKFKIGGCPDFSGWGGWGEVESNGTLGDSLSSLNSVLYVQCFWSLPSVEINIKELQNVNWRKWKWKMKQIESTWTQLVWRIIAHCVIHCALCELDHHHHHHLHYLLRQCQCHHSDQRSWYRTLILKCLHVSIITSSTPSRLVACASLNDSHVNWM